MRKSRSGVVSVYDDDYFFVTFPTGVRHVEGITIYTPKELEVVNGTSVKLKCTFSSTHPVSLQSVAVSWNFRPLNSALDESVCTNLHVSGLHFNVTMDEIHSAHTGWTTFLI